MISNKVHVIQYLARIKYNGPTAPSYEVLSKLQMHHLMNIPFENIDIQKKIKIDFTNLFDKIVIRKRGGICYELNGLFYELLINLGFSAKMVSARVFNSSSNSFGDEFDHLAIIVTFDNENYLTDIGFGDFTFSPIKIELNKVVNDSAGIFVIENFNTKYKSVIKKTSSGELIPEYLFSETERNLEDFYEMCDFHQTSSQSHFTKKLICSLPTINGRVTITGGTLKISEKGQISEIKLNNESEIENALMEYFGITI